MQEKFWRRLSISRSKKDSPLNPPMGDLPSTQNQIIELLLLLEVSLMLNSEQKDEVCDATKVDSSIRPDYI
jgi:hypothetical protein